MGVPCLGAGPARAAALACLFDLFPLGSLELSTADDANAPSRFRHGKEAQIRRSPIILITALLGLPLPALGADEHPKQRVEQVFRASQFRGASDVGLEGCAASSGEYSLWVYAAKGTCGVPREQADEVVLVRQPVPGVAPLRATISIPGDTYHLWVYGSGEKGHPWLHICGRNCLTGELPLSPGWVAIGLLEVRDMQAIFVRTLEVPFGHTLRLSALMLTSADSPPDWTP